MAVSVPNMSNLTLVAIGKTGAGKSSTCNTLLQTNEFRAEPGGLSTTEHCQHMEKTAWGRTLAMIDTPGTMDVKDMKAALDEMLKAIDLCPNGIDAFILVFNGAARATEEELKAAKVALKTFGPECYKRAIVVFTHAEEFKNDESAFQRSLQRARSQIPKLDKLLDKVDNRWTLLDNRDGCDPQVRAKQVKKLLELADKVAKNNPRRYSKGDRDQQIQLLEARKAQFEQSLQAYFLLGPLAQMMQQQQMMMQMAQYQIRFRELGHSMEMGTMLGRLMEQKNSSSSCTLL